jgi:hypothetical protein
MTQFEQETAKAIIARMKKEALEGVAFHTLTPADAQLVRAYFKFTGTSTPNFLATLKRLRKK